MSNEIATLEWDHNKIELIKNTVCKGASDDELQLFMHVCKHTGLDPFMKQIYSIARGGQRTIQTSIDGLRLIAERTGRYCPGREPTFVYTNQKGLLSATSFVKKQTKDGQWHETSATAYFEEYNAGNSMWKKMPHAMLAKCAEALALRKAFPAEMSGLYSDEEMHQADAIPVHAEKSDVKPLYIADEKPITIAQSIELANILSECSEEYQQYFLNKAMPANFRCQTLKELPARHYEVVKLAFTKKMNENHAKQKEDFEKQELVEVKE